MTSADGLDESIRTVRHLIEHQPADLDVLQRICRAAVEALFAGSDLVSLTR